VDGGEIRRIAPEEGPDSPESPRLRPCARGLSQAQRLYHADRVLYPLKRLGERGEARFQRVSWDEALDTVASEMRRIRECHGPEAVLNLSSSGNLDGLLSRTSVMANRFFNSLGGQTAIRGIISFEGARLAALSTFGFVPPPPGPESALKSRLVVMWGFNPSETIFGTNTNWYLALAKERGARFVFVDPRLTDSAAALADQWIPIRPGTDTAMLVAMAHVLFQEKLCDERFLHKYTYGFEKFRDYCFGAEDGIPKTPAWAETICGVEAQIIAGLAREYAASSPADLRGGWAPGRTAYGEQFHRACIALSAMTGNIGLPGGGPGCWINQDFRATLGVSNPPVLENPTGKSVVTWRWADAVLKGTAGGYPSDIKMVYSVGGNRLNQCADINKGVRALKELEFVVVQDQFLTPLARFADIVLPASTHLEREDIQIPHVQGNYLIYNRKVIEPLGESKSDLEILTALAERLGCTSFSDKTEQGWLEELTHGAPVSYKTLRSQGVYRYEQPAPQVPLQVFVADPSGSPLPTPSGKIEIFSQALARRQRPHLPPLPQYIELGGTSQNPSELWNPLIMVTTHSRQRVNSTFANSQWLQELEPDGLCMNSVDAEARSIRDGQRVVVHNQTGTVVIRAKVTERIMPGVVSIHQGAWYEPDEQGRDWGGSVNVLCGDAISPGEAAVTNGVPVEVARFEG